MTDSEIDSVCGYHILEPKISLTKTFETSVRSMSISWEQQDLFVSSVNRSTVNIEEGNNVQQCYPIRIARFPAANGIRELLIRKDEGGKIGVTGRRIHEGKVLICAVTRRSPAYIAGLRYGDEILCLENESLSVLELDCVRDLVRKNLRNSIRLRTKDKPGERYVTIERDVQKGFGFRFMNGEITFVRKNTVAERRGLERRLQIIEVNEEVVVGMQDEDIEAIINANDDVVTLCVVPVKVYRQLFSRLFPIVNDAHTYVEF
ncbi:syntenin-1-like [Anopheles marshallii]|uniref:syntenin-1-like n=1 Tax=Anopheles marshallii TaxID=1521116 RepID=UPI00237BE208|nr:syntenin-1-like [Anopheles marshallii]